ncbi:MULTISPECIES: phenylacetate--CoA ligase family protein [Brevibacillus]|jgi:phenylacetate-CoA ligase|uniref:phenylacetate--CoA ligase family protein n=1 Tax=Brevibacillus TaxID=55080 RepID=UPI000F07B4A8|nr:phenylacetate--CoA ligase family protein [Brevibacillus borstelensis]MBE5397101.1 phenylacetate--CoA ligase family protein [Brevibacillus borstelensis]MED1743142.1 phenylacetate--CoA ligase family protein [Brevibacillus borstelensis]MED1884608.1 phenylacetate--CoA ligase family protein [Brevibacillus borstelensis]RNB63563.1 phenylacetate--CoA ligase family protein [Brevibacillus borstelensis]GED50961.1 capsular polysaccharide biosynthesis protein [Brevibacillus borstelensis]
MPLTGSLIRNVQWPLMERFKQNRTRVYMHDLREAQALSVENLKSRQSAKLSRLLEHAVHHVPAYTEFAEEWHAAGNSEEPARFLQRLPQLEKSRFREQADRYLTIGANPGELIPNRTGGSTGEPTRFFLDRPTVERYEAARWLGLSWYGIRIGDPSVMIWGSPIELNRQDARRYQLKERWLKNRLMIPAYDLDQSRIEEHVRTIRRFRPVYLYGYASALALFAELMLQAGLRLGFPLKAVVSTAETLHDHQRAVITEAFEAPVVNEYGARDGGIIAYQCPAGSMHAFSENCYLEVVDPVAGEPLPVGEIGVLLVTDLHNRVMPRLRYQLGDMLALSSQNCTCGINYPVLQEIDGRVDDMFVSMRGSFVHGHFINHIIRNMESFRTFQLVQHEPDRLTLRLVKHPERFRADDEEKVLQGIRSALGDASIRLEYVKHIPPTPSGKTRYAIRECPLTVSPRPE